MTFTDAPPKDSAPRAGGSIVNPRPPKIKDDPAGGGSFDIRTTIKKRHGKKPVAAPTSATPSNDDTTTTTTTTDTNTTPILHSGGCHCGKIRFRCLAPPTLTVWDCNCSDCRLRRNVHFVVSKNDLTIIIDKKGNDDQSSPAMAEYRWGTGTARHLFCARCGITPFYVPRSNPEGYAVTFACLDEGTVADVIVRNFDGRHWEEFIDGEGGDIKSFSG